MKLAIRRLDSRQVAKHAKFRRKDKLSCKNCLLLFSDLCGLGVFAGDIPSFTSGSAVPKRSPWLYTPDKLPTALDTTLEMYTPYARVMQSPAPRCALLLCISGQ